MSKTRPLCSLEHHDLVEFLANRGEPSYRADQVFEWLYKQRAGWFDEMTNLPADMRRTFSEHFEFFSSMVTDAHTDKDGTVKLVVTLADGHSVESVMIPERRRRTACLSTQVGCPVGCVFCASGAKGFKRNLETAEIVEQAVHLTHALPPGERLTHIVFMGVGEGLLNFDRLAAAIRMLNAPWGLHVGARRMTVSTVGIPDTIRKLAQSPVHVNLAISIHAPNDEIRARLVPFKRLLRVDDLINEAEDFFEATGREVTFEYVLIAGVNDSAELASRLAAKIKPCHATVNLIPYNEIAGAQFTRPSREAVQEFRRTLKERGVRVTSRRTRGRGVGGACGQLRLDVERDNDARP